MKFLREKHDQVAPLFEKGGKLEKLYPLYEAQDTLLFTPGEVTKGKTHVRDALDLKRMMITVVVALLPAILMAIYNTGLQANQAIYAGHATPLDTWQTAIFSWMFNGDFAPTAFANITHGLLYFLPISIVTLAVGGLVEAGFAIGRGHEINEGFLVTWALFPLTLPPTIPLWQVALGIAFAVIFAKEVFGGTGMNILNVALVGRAFLFFAYPAQISGTDPWVAAKFVDGHSGATLLAQAADSSVFFEGADAMNYFRDAFLGFIPGSMGETSALAMLIGAAILIFTQIGSWRTMVGVALGTTALGLLFNTIGSETNNLFNLPFYWHFVLGGWALGAVFMATDPVTSTFTETGKWIYGFGIGAMVIIVRVVNPAYPEGMMLAILFMNMCAPFIDYFVVQKNIKRRLARHG